MYVQMCSKIILYMVLSKYSWEDINLVDYIYDRVVIAVFLYLCQLKDVYPTVHEMPLFYKCMENCSAFDILVQ